MKMVMISYNVAIEEEITELLEKLEITGYTKWVNVLGKGKASGDHLDSHIWPGKNCVLFLAVDERKKEEIVEGVRALRKVVGHEGVKAFVMPLEEVT